MKYLLLLLFLSECKCQRRIADGIETDDATKFPFFAQLQHPVYEKPNRTKKCGASLIHPKWILTAGHCFPYNTRQMEWLLEQTVDTVFMGTAKAYSVEFATKNSYARIRRHPKYRPIRTRSEEIAEYDIALGELKLPYELTSAVQTIKLATTFDMCKKGIMIGVGQVEDGSARSNYVKYTELQIKKASDIKHTVLYETHTTFFTDVAKYSKFLGGGYPLRGNSGGPFFCTVGSDRVQIGVFCGGGPTNGSAIGMYERVDKHLQFIARHVPYIMRHKPLYIKSKANVQVVARSIVMFIFLVLKEM